MIQLLFSSKVVPNSVQLNLIIMFLRTTLNVFFKSRQKLLIKRRKIQMKNRPLSKKRLKEESEQMNVAFETKLLNIRKEMDRTKSPNLHINQIVEDLFYPELRLNSQEDVDQRVRQVSSEAFSKEQEWEDLVRMDPITSQLNQSALPLELLEIHEQKGEEFLPQHYLTLMEKMSYYVSHIEAIKNKRMRNWQLMMKRVKTKGPQSSEIKCPYLFLNRQQIVRHQSWHNFVGKLVTKIQQQADINEVNNYIPTLLLIKQAFYFIPADLYLAVLNKNAAAPFKLLSTDNISDLLGLMRFRNKIKFDSNITIDAPAQSNTKERSHLSLARKLTSAVIDNPKNYTAQDLSNIFKIITSRNNKMHILNQRHFPLLQEIITPLLSELSFEVVETFFVVYCSFNQRTNKQFAEVIKYDLYRKAEQCERHFYLYDLITRIKKRRLSFRVYMPKGVDAKIFKLEAQNLLVKLSEVMIKFTNKLTPQELVKLLDTYYDSDVRDQSVIEILSTEIVKKGSELGLQSLGKCLFQLTVLGHSSKILAKYVFQEFDKKYHDQMKQYKEEGVFLLPTEQKVTPLAMNFKQIYLQECLLMALWSVTRQLGSRLEKDIDLVKLLDLIPLKIESGDPLAMELAININAYLKPFSMFPKIAFPSFNPGTFPMGRFKQLYFRDFSRDQIDKLMAEQAFKSKLFIQNYNPKTNLFLKERWSGQKVYNKHAYIEYCSKFYNNQLQTQGHCFYDQTVVLAQDFLTKRQKALANLTTKAKEGEANDSKENKGNKSTDLYDLLL